MKEAIERVERGLVDADLSGSLIKQRVARQGKGRSGGYRMIIAYRVGKLAVFIFGFAKNERENIDPGELAALREIADAWFVADPKRIAQAIANNELQEIPYGKEEA